MIEIYDLAEKIYSEAVSLKGQKCTTLVWRKNREKWLSSIAEIRENLFALEELLDYSYSEEYFGLIEFMKSILNDCERGLREKTYRYKAKSTNYMQAFHNLPRAFFSPENVMQTSAAEAIEHAEFWLNRENV